MRVPVESDGLTAREIQDRLRGRWTFHQALTSERSTRAALAELRDETMSAFRPLTELAGDVAEFVVWGFHARPSRDHAAAGESTAVGAGGARDFGGLP